MYIHSVVTSCQSSLPSRQSCRPGYLFSLKFNVILYAKTDNHFWKQFQKGFFFLNHDSEEADIFQETRERFWIRPLRTLQPQDINSMDAREYKRRRKQAVSNPIVPLSNQTRAGSSHSSQS